MCGRIRAVGLSPPPGQSPGGQRESYTLASTSASPSVPCSSPPQGLLSVPSVPSVPSFQLVIGLGGQNCKKCLKQITRPPHRCSFACCFTPFACWLLIKGTEADPAPPHSQPRSRLPSVAFSSLPPSPAAEHQLLCPPSSHLLNVWPGSHQPAGASGVPQPGRGDIGQCGEPSCASGRREQPQRKNIIRRVLVRESGPQGLNPILALAGWVTLGKLCHFPVPREFRVPIPPLSQHSIRIKGNQRGGDRKETGSPAGGEGPPIAGTVRNQEGLIFR